MFVLIIGIAILALYDQYGRGLIPNKARRKQLGNLGDPKRRIAEEGQNQGHRMIPDLIIHRRNTGENLLIVEFKKAENTDSIENDIQKLRDATNQNGPLRYVVGVFIRMSLIEQAITEAIVFVDGEQTAKSFDELTEPDLQWL